jgi:hypothetical protein
MPKTTHPARLSRNIAPLSLFVAILQWPGNLAIIAAIRRASIKLSPDLSVGWPMQVGRPFSRNSLWVIPQRTQALKAK